MAARRWKCGRYHWSEAFRIMRVPMYGDDLDLRKFNPSACGHRPNAGPDEVLSTNPNSPFVHVNAYIDGDPYRFALYADRACRGNGTPRAQASVGVYGTRYAWYNRGVLLPSNIRQTNQSAEIYSAIHALDVARAIMKERRVRNGRGFIVVLLVMDSSYVVRAMTEWIRKWRGNGFRNCRGQPVANMEALVTLDNGVRRLFEDHLVIVQFWHVPRGHNSGADWMAAQALRGHVVGYGLDSDLDELTERWWY